MNKLPLIFQTFASFVHEDVQSNSHRTSRLSAGSGRNQRNIVLMSFGSLIDTAKVPFWAYEKLLNAMEQFPALKFVVKFKTGENATLDALFRKHEKNVATMEWLPQTILLGKTSCE